MDKRPMYNVDPDEQERIRKRNNKIDGWTFFSILIIVVIIVAVAYL